MNRLFLALAALAAGIFLAACNAGDIPTKTYETKEEQKDPMTKSLEANPNVPEAARKAMGGQ